MDRCGITMPFAVPLHEHRRLLGELAELGCTDVWTAEVDGTDGLTPVATALAEVQPDGEVVARIFVVPHPVRSLAPGA